MMKTHVGTCFVCGEVKPLREITISAHGGGAIKVVQRLCPRCYAAHIRRQLHITKHTLEPQS